MRVVLLGLALLALFLGWNAPNHYPPWPAFHLETFAAAGICLLAAALLPRAARAPWHGSAAAESAFGAQPPLSTWGWCVAGAIPALQYGFGMLEFRGDAALGLLYGAGTGLAVYLGQLWASQDGRQAVVRTLCLTLLAAGLAATGLALVQWLRLSTPSWWAMDLIDDRPFANFAQPNHFGLATVLSIIAACAVFEMRVLQQRWVLQLTLAFLSFGVIISGSRASGLALAAVVALWALTRHRIESRLKPGDVAIAVAMGVALALAVEPAQHLLLLKETAARSPAEIGPRQWIWQHFWAAIQQRPWVGYGFDQGVAALAEVAAQVHPSRNVTYAHNVVLDLMTWFGIPTALVMVSAFCAWWGGWLKKTAEPGLNASRHWAFAMWLALGVQSMLEFPYAHAYFLLPLALFAGAGAAAARSRSTRVPSAPRVRHELAIIALTACIATALLFFTTVWEYARIESDFRFNRFQRANFSTHETHESLAAPLVLDQLGALNASAAWRPAPGMSAAQIDAMRKLSRRFHIPSVRLDYAKTLALNGRLADAEHELVVIRSVNDPAKYAQIEASWRQWLAVNASRIHGRLTVGQ
jgi:hypothetical protein